jgi:tetratricopeptide (TPR) repeat protein
VNWIGLVYLDQSDHARALAAFQESERLAVDAESREVRADALGNLGFTYSEMGLLDRAEESYAVALTEQRALGDSLKVATVLNQLALVRMARGNKEGALALAERVVAMGEASNTPYRAVEEARLTLASALDELGRVPEAQAEYRKSVHIALSLGRSDVLWRAYLGLGRSNAWARWTTRVHHRQAIQVLEGLRGHDLAEETGHLLGKWSYVYGRKSPAGQAQRGCGGEDSALIEEAFDTFG